MCTKLRHGKNSCKNGASGCCKQCATLLQQLHDYTQLYLKSIPDNRNCTCIFQQWLVPSNFRNAGAI